MARQQALLPREGATRLHVAQGLVLPPEQPEARLNSPVGVENWIVENFKSSFQPVDSAFLVPSWSFVSIQLNAGTEC